MLPISSCIRWEIGNLYTIMIFGNLSMCFGKFSVTKLPKPKICYVHFLMLSFIFYMPYLTVCVSVRKMSYKNLRCTFSSFFHADRHEIIFICHILLFLAEKWPRKWAIFLFLINSWFSKISQHVLQKSLWWIFKNQKSEM